MDNNQQVDITADLTEEQIWMTARSAQGDPFRAVAALAREGWRPIPQDEGDVITLFEPRANSCHLVPPAAEGEAQQPSQQLDELAEQLRELAEILTRMGFVTLAPPAWPSRLQRAAELLVHQQAFQPVLTKERPWEREGWLDQDGRCWMGNPGDELFLPSWRLCRPEDAPHMIWSLPHWAISVPTPGDAS